MYLVSHDMKIISSHDSVMRDWQHFIEYSSHSNWMWGILCIILSVSHNIVMALKYVMGISSRHGNFSNDTSCEEVYKYCHPNVLMVHPILVQYTS